MPIYTKTGDKGETSLFGGKRVKKFDAQVEAYGNIDELSSFLGLLIAKVSLEEEQNFLISIQEDLYKIMGFLAGAKYPIDFISARVTLFEQKIDKIQSTLPQLTNFILPVGTELSCLCHIVRTVARRTERSVVFFHSTIKKTEIDKLSTTLLIIQYLNRLSDLFFILARGYNTEKELKVSVLKK